MSSFYEEVERIFEEALALPAEERSAYLDRACEGEEELRARVQALLTQDTIHDDSFSPIVISEASSESPGRQIGEYTLVEPLGEGGFGSVWAADQQRPVQRRVALKILKLGMNSREVIARFAAERQSLAMMEHPGIAKVYDAGTTERGRPYFVMEYVDGRPLTEYCDAHELSTRERLELAREICAAVQHAHAKGVVHRDLKPSNILVREVDGHPAIKVIDFGIAKAIERERTGRTVFTEVGRLIGTPEYMSPEQATLDGADVDTRTDVYSLGIILYELLTGTVPISSRELHETGYDRILEKIRETDPPRPSDRVSTLGAELEAVAARRGLDPRALVRRLRGDLDWVVLKALERDRERRYETPMALARDLERYLREEPIEARPPSARYRLQKFVRRHRAGVAIGGALVVGLAIAAAALTYSWMDSQLQRARVESALAEAEAVEDFLTQMLASADVTQTGEPDLSVREVLDRSAAELGERFADRPLVEARIRTTLGSAYQGLGHTEIALLQAEQGLALRHTFLGADDARTYVSADALASVNADLGNYARAESLYTEAYENFERLLGPLDDQTLATMANLSSLLLQIERDDDARVILEELLDRSRRTDPPNTKAELDALGPLALIHTYAGEHEQAGEYYEENVRRSLIVQSADHPNVLSAKGNLALHYTDVGRWDDAIALLYEVNADRRRVLGMTHQKTLESFLNLGGVLGAVGRWEEAIEHYESMDATTLEILGPDHRLRHYLAHNLGYAYFRMGRFEEAERSIREGLTIRRRVLGTEARGTLTTENNLGLLLMQQERWNEARTLMEGNLERRSAAFGPDHAHTRLARRNLAQLKGRMGEVDAAREELQNLYEAFVDEGQAESQGALLVRAVLGDVLLRDGDLDGARRELDAAAALADQLQPRAPDRIDYLRWQIELCRRQGRNEDRQRWEAALPES